LILLTKAGYEAKLRFLLALTQIALGNFFYPQTVGRNFEGSPFSNLDLIRRVKKKLLNKLNLLNLSDYHG